VIIRLTMFEQIVHRFLALTAFLILSDYIVPLHTDSVVDSHYICEAVESNNLAYC